MSTQFCPRCANYVVPKEHEGNLLFVCKDCEWSINAPVGEAIKIFENTRKMESDFAVNPFNVAMSTHDILNPRAEMPCMKCDARVMTYVRGRETLARMFICPECGASWVEDR